MTDTTTDLIARLRRIAKVSYGAKFEDGEWLELRYGYKVAMWHDDFDSYWSPLESNADAFALAVKLDINLEIGEPGFGDVQVGKKDHWACEWLNADDPCASVRRAIVRAAAEIGRGMP